MWVDGEKKTGARVGIVRVVADHRERPSGVPDLLAMGADVEVSFAQLPVGDYKIDDRILFERKTIDDFAESIIDSRLFRQASRLSRGILKPALIVEGSFSQARLSVSREAMQGALISLTLVFGLPVLRSTDPDETARLIIRFSTTGCRKTGRERMATPHAEEELESSIAYPTEPAGRGARAGCATTKTLRDGRALLRCFCSRAQPGGGDRKEDRGRNSSSGRSEFVQDWRR